MYKPKYFSIKELVNPILLNKIGIEIAWLLLDPYLLKSADKIREKYGPCTINIGELKDCGLRDWTTQTGAKYSAHKFARALDLHLQVIEKTAKTKIEKTKMYNKIRQELLQDPEFELLNFEDNISWLHIDTFNRPRRIFNP